MQPEENSTDAGDVVRIPLKSLGLRTGMALQTRRLVDGASKKEAQFFGAIEGKGVMVGPMGGDGQKTELEEGEVCVVRGFTGQYEYSFLSKVLQTFEKPFAYALLAYPAQVDARQVRQSMRTKTSWPSSIQVPNKNQPGEKQEYSSTLVDISLHGAMVKAPPGLGSVGDSVTLSLSITFENAPMQLQLQASICHNNKAPNEALHYVGLAFKNTSQQDKLVLHYITQHGASQ